IYLAGSLGPEWLFWITILAFIGGFWKLIKEHNQIDQAIRKFTIWRAIRSRHLARQSLQWDGLPRREPTANYSAHPFASDLNIIGDHSLLQLIDTATYQGGTDTLAEYLLTEER